MENQLVDERKKRFLMLVPLIAVPFLSFLFYMMGGGRGKPISNKPGGLNTTLPSPAPETGKPMDKLSLYQQADKDSLDRLERQQSDPFGQWQPLEDTTSGYMPELPSAVESPFSNPDAVAQGIKPLVPKQRPSPEKKVEDKLRALEKLLADSPADTLPPRSYLPPSSVNHDWQLEQQETPIQPFAGSTPTVYQQDEELVQMNGMLEKILDIQHPSRINDRIKERSAQQKDKVFPVSADPDSDISDILLPARSIKTDTSRPEKILLGKYRVANSAATGSFYEQEEQQQSPSANSLAAVIHQNQTVTTGSTVKLRLLQNAYVQGQLIPKGNFVFGICNINGERLNIAISSIRVGNSLYPVSLATYDLDGLPGIQIPGSLNRDAAKEQSDQAMQAISMGTLDPSLGAQATAAGIEAAKSLLKKKVKIIKVFIKADYPVLLSGSQQ